MCPAPDEFFYFELNGRKFKACKARMGTAFYEGDKFLVTLEQTDITDPKVDLVEVKKSFLNILLSQEREAYLKAQRLELLRKGNFF